MSIHLHHNHQVNEFLRSKEMNEIYLSYGLQNFALGMISIFIPVYLYKIGYSIPWILFFYLLLPFCFVVFGYWGARAVARLGVKKSILVSIMFLFLQLAGLKYLPVWGWLFYLLPLINALKAMFYNYSFNLNFVQHSDSKHRGRQVAGLQAVSLVASLLSPFLGGLIIKFFGFTILFVVAAILLFASVIPLVFVKEKSEPVSFNQQGLFSDILSAANRPIAMSHAGFAVEEWIGFVLWPIFLTVIFISTESIGAISSLAACATFLVLYFVGKISDKRDKRSLIRFGTILYFFGWVGRVFANSFMTALFVDTYKRISGQILQVPWTSYIYDIASKRDHFKFVVEREIIFDLSRVIVAPLIILIFIINYHPFAFSFSVAAVFSLLYMSLNQTDLAAEAATKDRHG